jgi:hypothetical protein
MNSRTPFTLRIPLLLLAAVDLAVLAVRLRPWPDIVNLPGEGTTGYDPVICLVAYLGLLSWIGGNRNIFIRKALSDGALLGLGAGLLLVAQVVIATQPAVMGSTMQLVSIQIGLLVAAGVLWGIAGMRGSRVAGNPSIGIVAGVWSAMVGALMACAAVLAQINLNNPAPQSQDPWKQYEGLAIGNPATQALVHSLNTATGFLLITPLVGGAVGFIFALLAQDQ